MDIVGRLEIMNLPTLIQFFAQEGDRVHIQIEKDDGIGSIYLEDGQLCHADLQIANNERRIGEEVVYELLSWHSGKFKIQKKVEIPVRSINTPLEFLLMEGLRKMDEQDAVELEEPDENVLADIFSNLSETDIEAIQNLMVQQEDTNIMASKSEQLQAILNEVVNGSSDINGAVVVDNDGLLLASALSGNQDGNRVAAVTAGLISLAGRSAQQLGQGDVNQTLIQAANGNVVALRAGTNAAFVALTPSGGNLGMTFMECRDAASRISSVLG